jgi:glucokinase
MTGRALVGDIGGTHARLALADESLALTEVRDYRSAEFDDAIDATWRQAIWLDVA